MELDDLHAALGAATSVPEACRSAVGVLARHAPLMPSVYLARGGRLRLMGVHGYWQVLDGMQPHAGVIGATYASGTATIVRDVRQSPAYLAAATGVRSEACFPIRVHDTVVGVLNAESTAVLAPDDVVLLEAAADALGSRMERLGGVPLESAAQRLVRHCARLADLQEAGAIEQAVLAAALDISALDSAMIVATGPGIEPRPTVTAGPLAPLLTQVPPGALRTIAGYVAAGTSAYTVGAPSGEAGTGIDELRQSGVESLLVLAVGTSRVLVVASSRRLAITTDEVELLELLCTQAASCLRTAASLDLLRTQAATDPLTGLGHHATFHAALTDRLRFGALGVLMIDVDGFKSYNDRHGHPAGDRVLREVSAALASALRRGDGLFRVGGDEFSALIAVRTESDALEAARRLHGAVAFCGAGITVSIGVAYAEGEGTGPDAVARADRALYQVKEHGRNGVAVAERPPPSLGSLHSSGLTPA